MLCRSQLSEVLLAEGPRYTPVQQGLNHFGLLYANLLKLILRIEALSL